MTRVNSYVKMNSRNISFHNYIDILTFWLPKSPVLVYKGISKIYKGKCGPSAFFIFFFEKNISDGQISRDCVPEAQTLLLTPISGYNDHYSKNGLNGHNRQNGHNWPNGQTAILAIMIIIARYGCQKKRLGFRNAVQLSPAPSTVISVADVRFPTLPIATIRVT